MATQTSSLIGVSLTASDTTAQFALGTRVTGGGVDWEYVLADVTITTGKCVYISPTGTGVVLNTGNIKASTAGLQLAWTQFQMNAGEYGFAAINGGPVYIACSGTTPPTTQLAYMTSGVMVTSLAGPVGCTAAGVYVTTSASVVSVGVATGMLSFPRPALVTGTPA